VDLNVLNGPEKEQNKSGSTAYGVFHTKKVYDFSCSSLRD